MEDDTHPGANHSGPLPADAARDEDGAAREPPSEAAVAKKRKPRAKLESQAKPEFQAKTESQGKSGRALDRGRPHRKQGQEPDDEGQMDDDDTGWKTQASKRSAGKRRDFLRRPMVWLAAAALVVLLLAIVLLWWLHARNYESTDDAFIDTHIVRLSPETTGRIVEVHVQDNQLVQPGDALIDIDSADAQARVDQAAAQLAQAQTSLAQAQAQERTAQASHNQAIAAAAGVRAQADNAAQDLARYHKLAALNKDAVAQAQIDQAEAQARNTAAQATAAVKQADAAAGQSDAAAAQIGGANAQIASLKAQLDEARIVLGHTRIVAPIAGHIAQRNAATGNYVTPGQQLLAIIPLQLWVTANFKETQLAHMRAGQPVSLRVDACPDAHITGHVDSIQRGAGQAFGILPPENATGNFVKVVQRVPVKIAIDKAPQSCPLGPGMSVEPSVTVR